MELVPNTENVVFIDEYPELQKRVWLRRLDAQRRVGQLALFDADPGQLLLFPEQDTPDGAA